MIEQDYSEEKLNEMDLDALMTLYHELTHDGIMTEEKVGIISKIVSIIEEKKSKRLNELDAIEPEVWTTRSQRYYKYRSPNRKIHIAYVKGRGSGFHDHIFMSTLCGHVFDEELFKWQRVIEEPATCIICKQLFKEIEPSVIDIIDFELDFHPFGVGTPLPAPVIPRTCITCMHMCHYWNKSAIERHMHSYDQCAIYYRTRRIEKLWEIKLTTDHMRQISCKRLYEIYDYIMYGDPIGLDHAENFLTRLLMVMNEKSCKER